MKIGMQKCIISFKNGIKLCIKTNNWQIVHVVEAEWISIYITVAFHQECLDSQPQLPSFHPSRHLSSTRLQSNSGFPVFLFTWLCNLHIHWESSSRDDVCGVFVFSLKKKERKLQKLCLRRFGNALLKKLLLFTEILGTIVTGEEFRE